MLALTDHASCRHCGSPVPDSRKDGFCCAGCAYVFEMLHAQGFDHFYDLKGDRLLPPVAAQAMREQDYDWLRAQTEQAGKLTVSVQGLTCVGCVWLMERVFANQPGARRITVDVVRGEAVLEWEPGAFDPVLFATEMQRFGYLLGPQRADEQRDEGLSRRTGVCGAFAMNAMAFSLPAYFGMPPDFMFAKWFDLVAAMSATLALLVGGSYFAERAWRALSMGVLHIDTPITLGILAAYLGSVGGWLAGVEGLKYFDFVAIFIFLMLGGRWVQQLAVARNRRKLLRDPSISESVEMDGKEVAIRLLKAGDEFTIKPGQAVPVAAQTMDAAASISMEWINGESAAQVRQDGQLLPAGALNIGTRSIAARALETWEDSTLRKLLDARKSGDQRDERLETLLRVYLFAVVLIGISGALWWWLVLDAGAKAIQVMISVFVVSCPCALGVAAPLADDLAASRAERLGVFVRSLGLWKKLSRVRKVIFDKTGTLTLENPVLIDSLEVERLEPAARAALRHLVSGNLHPISRSLFDSLGPGTDDETAEVQEDVGHGLEYRTADGVTWSTGRNGWRGTAAKGDAIFCRNGIVLAAFAFRDELRSESVAEVSRLRQAGISVFVLSGDRKEKVHDLAGRLGLPPDCWRAEMTPAEKAAWVAEHDAHDTLYAGDGANDSLAFDAALCAGSPVSGRSFLEHKADFYFLGHSLGFVGGLLSIGRLHRRAIHRVFGFALAYNIATATAGLMGLLSPLLAAILMPLSSVATLSVVAWTFGSSRPQSSRAGEVTPKGVWTSGHEALG